MIHYPRSYVLLSTKKMYLTFLDYIKAVDSIETYNNYNDTLTRSNINQSDRKYIHTEATVVCN